MNSEEEQLVAETFDSILSELVIDKCKQVMDTFLPQFSRELIQDAADRGEL